MIGLIVARSKNNCIGKNGKIPWKIKGEQKQFKELTTGNVVVMGRNSYDEIGHPLPNRETIVISKSKKYVGRNIHTASSVKEAIELAKGKDVYIAGGYAVMEQVKLAFDQHGISIPYPQLDVHHPDASSDR